MSVLAAAGDLRAAEATREMAWEQLHSGPWHSVLPVWRDAYSMACLYVAKLHHRAGDFGEALKVLDMGLIMGGTLLRQDLHAAVEKVTAKASELRVSEEEQGEVIVGGETRTMKRSVEAFWVVHEAEDFLIYWVVYLCMVLGVLPMKSLSSKIIGKSDCMGHWPARTRWNDMDYLKRVAGDRTVPVEVGKNYLSSDWKQELITFSQFLERIQSSDCTSTLPTYLAQHPLFDQARIFFCIHCILVIHELRKDIFIPDYCYAGGGELRSLNAWFGPAGTVTPLHHDPHHNILAQVVGKKYIRLYPASLSEELTHTLKPCFAIPASEFQIDAPFHVVVDLDNIDEKEFPKVKDLEFQDCILEEGEMLYIPPKWWHYVRSLTTSFSVSFWWSNCGGSPAS
ncbi:Lysine-specific demethylase JMJ30 [Vitis vinifera]|uniref:Lysine-specific demethylase JMJ30 n=1 Tax=Vitis vinifera TaxID=29760 RepID=A0A438JVU7_VITVI|nr:Lysine-specific demethylase JMJ30 [Vitis vinifera]